MHNFLGKDGFNWWMGVVESRDDPLNMCRCRVRIFGLHTDNKELIPTDDLPWALPGFSPNSSWNSSTPIVGDYVFGFFVDGSSSQAPIMLAVFPGIPKGGPNPSVGFSEGEHYPIGEPTTSRLYRNEKIDETPIGYHNSNLDTSVSTGDDQTWSEPASQYNTKPPYNNVMETLSGHVFEMDDTPGSERIHLHHKSNTFFEIAPDGTKVTKVVGDNYEIIVKDNNVHIKGGCNITIDGNSTLYVKGDVYEKIDGNVVQTVKGNVTETVNGNVSQTVDGSLTQSVTGSVTQTITGTFSGEASSWSFSGDISVAGSVTTTGDVVAGSISVQNHRHRSVRAGTDISGTPV